MASRPINFHMRPPPWQTILRYLDGLRQRAPLPELHELLKNSPLTMQDVEEHIRFDDHDCCRSVISQDTWHILFLVCWRPGQGSSIHDHAGSSCAFKIMAGVCTETVFGVTAGGQADPIENHTHDVGTVVAAQDSDVHQISNLQRPGENLVTLHLYSPPLTVMQTFSILKQRASQGPDSAFLPLSGGSGI